MSETIANRRIIIPDDPENIEILNDNEFVLEVQICFKKSFITTFWELRSENPQQGELPLIIEWRDKKDRSASFPIELSKDHYSQDPLLYHIYFKAEIDGSDNKEAVPTVITINVLPKTFLKLSIKSNTPAA